MTTADCPLLDCKILWIVGATERLATLGFFEEIPLSLTKESIDYYLEIDEKRDELFENDLEMVEILNVMLKCGSKYDVLDDDVEIITKLLLEYKNNRINLVKKALDYFHGDS